MTRLPQIGFTPPVRALLQFPDTLDMMCRELGWTTELGEAFIADQAGVLDAVQRLRRQAKDVGNLQSSPQMTVDTQTQSGKEVIVLEPPASTETVYVPQYDPVAVYAPAPATTEVAPATTTTTTTTTETDSGYSTGAMVTTGLLSFGAGMLVANLFDDDDDHHNNDYYYPNYGHGGMPYYPPYPYRPNYGNGYYPSNGYRPPAGYGGGGFHNSGNIIVTNPGGGRGNGYWDRYDNNRAGAVDRNDRYKSPISSAKPGRSDLNDLNKRQARAMPADVKRPNKDAAPRQYKGNQTYAGAKNGGYKGAAKGAAGTTAANRPDARPSPKVQGSYKGAPTGGSKVASNSGYKGAGKDMAKPASRPAQTSTANRQNTGKAKSPSSGGGDRGYSKPTSQAGFDVEAPVFREAGEPQSAECGRWQAEQVIGHVRLRWRRQGQQGRQPARQAEHAAGRPQQRRWRWWWRWRWRRQAGQALGDAHEHHQDAIFRAALLRGSRLRRCAGRMRQGRGSQLVQDAGSSGRRVRSRDSEGRRAAHCRSCSVPGAEDLLSSGDAVQDKADRDDFVARYQQKHSLAAGWRRCDDAHRRRQRLADADPDRQEGRQVATGWRGRRRRDHLPARRRERARRDRREPRIRRCAERVRGCRSRRRSGGRLRAEAHQRRRHAERPLLAHG